ncbi:MAG: 23S rRNA (guanine(745)-N(1))-methyltransferase [Gammaproteobacteria bacterium]|nr:23S rRNA (guanine(745)-N(1))-methyltransferase [Gammaproteobacteria bacterium]
MTKFNCPLCSNPLQSNPDTRGLSCSNNHQFDRAKQGYFNLLPVQHKKSKQPGDSKEMITARHDFLAGNHYQPLAEKISQVINQQVENHPANSFTMLDLGCGEGYYSRIIKQQIPTIEQYGIDISKAAVISAAKADKTAHYAVASSDKLPLVNDCIDLVLKVYAPSNDDELQRVVTDNGLLLIITPAPRHLWQLREFIYQDVRAHDTQDSQFAGFKLLESQQLSYNICPTGEHRIALLQMTPFAWRANEQVTADIAAADGLEIELDFIINLYQRIVD